MNKDINITMQFPNGRGKMAFCKICKNLISYTKDGEVCKNPKCWSNKYVKGNFVVYSKNLKKGPAKVIDVFDKKVEIRYSDGSTETVLQKLIAHHQFDNGTKVKLEEGVGVIMNSEFRESTIGYIYTVFVNGEETSIPERMIINIELSSSISNLDSGDFEDPVKFCLRNQAFFFQVAQSNDEMICINNSRVDIMPHQVGIAYNAIQEYNPRFILADEVGLGKTMEAGLILKELKARGLAEKVLISVPANLVSQWQLEMKSKFNENFIIYNGNKLKTLRSEYPDDNPWSLTNNVLTSFHFARNYPEDISSEDWDMVILDEAHHFRRNYRGGDEKATKAYKLAEKLRDRCNSLLLLTATPMQLETYEFYSLIELVDPGRFKNYPHFEMYRTQVVPFLNEAIPFLTRFNERWAKKNKQKIEEITYSVGKLRELYPLSKNIKLPSLNNSEDKMYDENWRKLLLRELNSYRFFQQYMMRNRKVDVFKTQTGRNARIIKLVLTPEEKDIYNMVSEYVRTGYARAKKDKNTALGFVMVIFQKLLTSSKSALYSSFRKRIYGLKEESKQTIRLKKEEIDDFEFLEDDEKEEIMENLFSTYTEDIDNEIKILENICDRISRLDVDTKFEKLELALDEIFDKDPKEKVLIFTQFIATQEYIRKMLSRKYSTVVFNGKMSSEDKEQAVGEFRNSAQIMIATESAGEGRNFQFCHIMFNYDLPWNPMKVEQRIGRLDRIGQKKKVFIYNFSYVDTVEQRILDLLYSRLGLFKETIGALEPILGEIEGDIKKIIFEDVKSIDHVIEKYESTWEERIQEANDIQNKLDDFCMDKRLIQTSEIDQLVNKRPEVTSDMVKTFVIEYVKLIGGQIEQKSEKEYVIQLPQNFMTNKCRVKRYRGTFDLEYARQYEEIQFFAFGHPLIEDLFASAIGKYKQASSTVLKLSKSSRATVKGVMFVYVLRFNDYRKTTKLIPFLIRTDGKYAENASEKLFQRTLFELHKLETFDGDLEEDIDYEEFRKVAEEKLISMSKKEIIKIIKNNSEKVEEERARVHRLYQFRISKLQDQIEKEEKLIGEYNTFGTENQRKMIPAVKGRIAKREEEIENNQKLYDKELERFEELDDINYQFTLVSEAVIIY